MMTTHPFVTTLDERFGGLLSHGPHAPDGIACALEAASVARGGPWSDDPGVARLPDLRSLNDARWPSNEARTEALVPLVIALWDWAEWSDERRTVFMSRVIERTIREVLPIMLHAVGLDAAAERCEREGTRDAARAATLVAGTAADDATSAVDATAYATVADTAYAAAAADYAAAHAAASAADAAAVAAETQHGVIDAYAVTPIDILSLACRIWTEEAT